MTDRDEINLVATSEDAETPCRLYRRQDDVIQAGTISGGSDSVSNRGRKS
jgi:hypothetical protein